MNEWQKESSTLKKLSWLEAVRIRPGMYVGNPNTKGFIALIKNVFCLVLTTMQPQSITLQLDSNYSGKLIFQQIELPIKNLWSNLQVKDNTIPDLDLFCFNALCDSFQVKLINELNKEILQQEFQQGVFINGQILQQPIVANQLKKEFTLDQSIWQHNLEDPIDFIQQEIREFAFLQKQTNFNVVCNKNNTFVTYHFKQGLIDKIIQECAKGIGNCSLTTYLATEINHFSLEVAFAFKEYSVDIPFVQSYVNFYETPKNGTHLSSVIIGIQNALTKYVNQNNPLQEINWTMNAIQEYLVVAVHLQHCSPKFAGSIKYELKNEEIINPIVTAVTDAFFATLNNNSKFANQLLVNLIRFND